MTDHTSTADLYVLGLLDDAEANAFERAAMSDEGAARAIATSRDRFLPLDAAAAPVPLPLGFRDRLEKAIDDAAHGEGGKRPAIAGTPAPANDAGSPGRSRSLGVMTALAASLVLTLGVGYGIGTMMTQAEPAVIAVLLDDAGAPRALVEDFGDDSATIRFLSDVDVPDDRVMQVWTLPSEQMGPVSLGLVEAVQARRLSGPDLPAPANDQLYEITLEPSGGSPTGRPTGPILAKGFAASQ